MRHPLSSILAGLALVGSLTACEHPAEPPGRRAGNSDGATSSLALPVTAVASSVPDSRPTGPDRIASIAMRTWVYQQPDPQSTKLGYLRAGAVVGRAEHPAGTRGCQGGWFAVQPRGFVCVGKGASLQLDHPVVLAAAHGPRRGQAMPYRYVISRKPPPHLYFKLPSLKEQLKAEGKRRASSMALFGISEAALLGEPETLPAALAQGKPLPKPYGAERSLSLGAHRGRAGEESAFGLIATFDWTKRRMGLTTELDIIPLDRTRIARLSSLRGIEIKEPGIPAFVIHHGVRTYKHNARKRLTKHGKAPHRSGWLLTGKNNGSSAGLLETTAGVWLPAANLRIAKLREDPAGFARDGRKWIDVSIRRQLLVAYEGKRPVYATLVSTGRDGMRDPATTHATIRGTYMIHAKHVSATMDGDEDTREAFDLRDVPYVQYFHKGYALHGAYWHDSFGKVRSHGCINLAPADAAWLFEWTDPVVPVGWHGSRNPKHGTLVYTHG